MKDQITDQQLIRLIEKSPSDGISLALDLYGGAVKTICSSILSGFSESDIEETVSDSFTSLWRSISHYDYDKHSTVKSYLYGIARNLALNKKRSLSKHPSTDLEKANLPSVESAEEQVSSLIESQLIYDAIVALKSPDKEIFIHRYFLDERVKAIAMALNLTEKSVENRLRRGKLHLKAQLIKRGVING